MTATQLRKQIARRVRRLSAERLKVADDFMAYLEEREPNAATRELLAIPGLTKAIERGMRDVAAGRTVPFSKVRRDV
ncbi:MAG: hypothetical protein IMZ44_05520 [Planctomycetes bacterium]|nr:hypothetical protein [Planctomycetota bacterium]